jgi:dihydrofolate reductase
MAKLLVQEFLTLDGVMQGPGGPDEDRSDGFDQGGWLMPYGDAASGKFVRGGIDSAGAFLLGRKTYDIFASYWPFADNDLAHTMNQTRKFVASRTLSEPLSWDNSTLIKGDAADAIARIKETEASDLLVFGSGGLVQTLIAKGLVDELRLLIHPLVLGKGKRLFRDAEAQARLRLADWVVTTTGVVLATYVPQT